MAAARGFEDQLASRIHFAPACTQPDVSPASDESARFLIPGRNCKCPLRIDKAPTAIPADGGQTFLEVGVIFIDRIDSPMPVLVDKPAFGS